MTSNRICKIMKSHALSGWDLNPGQRVKGWKAQNNPVSYGAPPPKKKVVESDLIIDIKQQFSQMISF